jgi:hypothetical protein
MPNKTSTTVAIANVFKKFMRFFRILARLDITQPEAKEELLFCGGGF